MTAMSGPWQMGKFPRLPASYPPPFIQAFERRAGATLASLQPFPLSGERGDWPLP